MENEITRRIFLAAGIAGALMRPVLNNQGAKKMTENEKLIREFIKAWSRLDAAQLASYFAEDGC